MYTMLAGLSLLLVGTSTALPSLGLNARQSTVVNSTTCNGQVYQYLGLSGYGFVPSNARDKYGDTLGGMGSAAAVDPKTWTLHQNGSYTGLLYAQPDRGWNTEGTLNYNGRLHKFHIVFDPANTGPSRNLQLYYLDTVLYSLASGTPFTGLDADMLPPYLATQGATSVPSSTFTGDGFGGSGSGGDDPTIDAEGLVLLPNGEWFTSDEYGDYIYHFSAAGKLIQAIAPPTEFLPIRNNSISFNAASPPRYNPNLKTTPTNPTSGRANNQGFEGLSASPDGKYMYALTQSALIQDGGSAGGAKRRWSRLVKFNLSAAANGSPPPVVAQYVVPLPIYNNSQNASATAAQSELKFISDTQFFVLARDSGAGHGQSDSMSRYRHIDVFDISKASDVSRQFSIAPNGTLNASVTPATYCPFLDYNINSQLAKFGLHNGGAQDANLLNEKWESMVLLPVSPPNHGGWSDWTSWSGSSSGTSSSSQEYYLFSMSDNDFITQDGYLKGGQFKYSDESGYNLDNQMLVFKISLPAGSNPRIG